jgi:hypothetical protein
VTFTAARAGEAAAAALAGTALGGASALVLPLGLALPIAVAAGANGAISGWRGIYRWRTGRGALAFVLDSTWAAATTTAGLLAHAVGAASRDAGYAPALSRRQNRHVYSNGFCLRKGFAVTLGNVVNGAGDLTRSRRAKLVTDHEDVHVWQARWFGPAYPVLYGGWLVGGALAGGVLWVTRRRHERLGKVIESCAYYLNPFEWWAYSRDDHWPPSGKLASLGWKRPCVRPFTETRAGVVPPGRR